jgi:hypothetical protein
LVNGSRGRLSISLGGGLDFAGASVSESRNLGAERAARLSSAQQSWLVSFSVVSVAAYDRTISIALFSSPTARASGPDPRHRSTIGCATYSIGISPLNNWLLH